MTRIEHAGRHRHAHRIGLGQRCGHAWREEQGFSLIWSAFGFMAMFAATTLAIDVGMLMTARNQAQNAADAGALAGATALAFNSFADHSASGPAVTSAMNTAKANQVIGEAPDVTPADVTFLNDPLTGRDDIVQVQVHRTAERGNPVKTLLARIYGVSTADISVGALLMAIIVPGLMMSASIAAYIVLRCRLGGIAEDQHADVADDAHRLDRLAEHQRCRKILHVLAEA